MRIKEKIRQLFHYIKGIVILENVLKSTGILVGATMLSLLFHQLGFTDSNIIMVYILGVLLTSIATSHRVYSLVSSIASVFIFNYLAKKRVNLYPVISFK